MAHLEAVPEILPLYPATSLMSRASISFFSRVCLSSASLCPCFCGLPVERRAAAVCRVAQGTSRRGPGSARAAGVGASAVQLKEDWLRSISYPFPEGNGRSPGYEEEKAESCSGSQWVLGIDPDVSGALSLLKGDAAEVFDTPYLKVLVGKTLRKRPDARSIIQLLHSLGAPRGTTAYIEQSTPYPQDGKQGWWSGGYTYGLWIGILVATGFSVFPVSSRSWKDHFQLYGSLSCKDASRETAIAMFPSLSSQLKRKKDHGRAEALLIAAYGKGLSK